MVVGFVVYRWGGDANFEVITVQANDFVTPCPWLDVNGKEQILTIPLIPGLEFGHRPDRSGRQRHEQGYHQPAQYLKSQNCHQRRQIKPRYRGQKSARRPQDWFG